MEGDIATLDGKRIGILPIEKGVPTTFLVQISTVGMGLCQAELSDTQLAALMERAGRLRERA